MKVVSERLGHAHIAHTVQTYQHLLPGMSAGAGRTIEQLTGPVPTTDPDTVERRRNIRKEHRLTRRNAPFNDEGPGR